MKRITKFLEKTLLLILIIGLSTGCSNEDSNSVDEETQSANELKMTAEVDKAEVVISDILIEVYEAQELQDQSRLTNPPPVLPDCVTITLVAEQYFRELTLDFGNEGCMIHGHILRGQIVLSYERNPEAQQVLIDYSLIDFYFDQKQIEGSKTLLKELSNNNGNPQFTHTLDLTVTWPNGMQATRQGQKVKEWVEGFASGVFSDNVFEITGYWNSTFVNGNTHAHTVITPLRREVICTYFVSGSIDVDRTNFSGIFDYGSGDCDNQATFTFDNGTVIDVILN
jgi:hypothetical protein